MDYLQYSKDSVETLNLLKVLNLIINGLPSILNRREKVRTNYNGF